MKKLLSILAAVGLTATASTAVVACTSTIKAKDVKVEGTTATFTVKKVKATEDMKTTEFAAKLKADFGMFAKKDKKEDNANVATEITTDATKDVKKGDKINLTVKFTVPAATDKDQNLTYYFGKMDSKGVLSEVLDNVKFTVAKTGSSNNGGGDSSSTVKDVISETTETLSSKAANATATFPVPQKDGAVVFTGWDSDDDKTATLTGTDGTVLKAGTDYTITGVDDSGKEPDATTGTATKLVVTFKAAPTQASYTLKIAGNSCIADVTLTINAAK